MRTAAQSMLTTLHAPFVHDRLFLPSALLLRRLTVLNSRLRRDKAVGRQPAGERDGEWGLFALRYNHLTRGHFKTRQVVSFGS